MTAKKAEKRSNDDLKAIILQANIEHGDVALRALSRIDSDAKFRGAIRTIVDAGDNVPDAIHEFVYTQFSPSNFRGTSTLAEQRKLFQKDVKAAAGKLKAAEVVKLLNARTLEIAIDKLTDKSIEAAITKLVTHSLKEMMCGILGLRDSFGVEVSSRKDSPLRAKIEDKIAKKLDKAFDAILDESVDLDKLAGTRRGQVAAALKNAYKEAFTENLFEAGGKWATKHAALDVEKLIEKATGEKIVVGKDDEDDE